MGMRNFLLENGRFFKYFDFKCSFLICVVTLYIFYTLCVCKSVMSEKIGIEDVAELSIFLRF